MFKRTSLLALALSALVAGQALAQTTFPTPSLPNRGTATGLIAVKGLYGSDGFEWGTATKPLSVNCLSGCVGGGGGVSIGTVKQGDPGTSPWPVAMAYLPAFAAVPAFNLSQIAGTPLTLGQKTAAASIPVVLPSDGTQATAILQTAGNTSLASLDAKTPAASTLPTLANQAAGNASLASIDAKATGQATAAKQDVMSGKLDTINSTLTSTAPSSGTLGAAPAAGANIAYFQVPSGAPAFDTVVKGASTDVGGTITAGGTAQTFMTGNPSRRGWTLQNQSTADLYVNCTALATADWHSLKISAGAFFSTDPHHVGTGACSILGATTGQAFYARQF